jgi:hypothetical protein
LADFHAEDLPGFIVLDDVVGGEGHVVGIEAGVGEREDEAACGFEQFAERIEEGVDDDHIHHGHAADGGVEAGFAEGEELGHIGGVDFFVFDLAVFGGGAAAGGFEEVFAVVAGDDFGAFAGEMAGVVSVATGDVEDGLAGFGVEEAIGGGDDEGFLEIVSFADLLVPPVGDVFPGDAGLLDGGAGGRWIGGIGHGGIIILCMGEHGVGMSCESGIGG